MSCFLVNSPTGLLGDIWTYMIYHKGHLPHTPNGTASGRDCGAEQGLHLLFSFRTAVCAVILLKGY